jgi:membrane protease YdiL (CAAX protease family)
MSSAQSTRRPGLTAWLTRHALLAYYVLAYACSWIVAVPLALQAQGVTATRLPWALHYATAFGPAVAAVVLTRLLRRDQESPRSARHDAGWHPVAWWAIGFGSPLLLFVVAQVTSSVAGQPRSTWTSLGHVNFLPDLAWGAWLLWFCTSGWGEETGWRGFALPRLQQSHSAFTSSVLLAVAWAGWHVPAFFYVPSYAAVGPALVPGFFLGILAGSIVLTWLYNSSGGSLLAVVLWHASFNFVTGSPNASGLVAAVTSSLVMVWALVVLLRCGPFTLTSSFPASRTVQADSGERTRALPGDERIPQPVASLTHATTIRRLPRDVWPWIAQMGAGSRAGWYSYDFLDNGRRPSARRIVSELQNVSVGTIFPALPGVTDAFIVLAIDPGRFLLLGWLSPAGTPLTTWAFVLEELAPDSTRLIVRARAGTGYRFHGLPSWLTTRIVPIVHFVMQRKQLLGIARRAESPSTDDTGRGRSSQSRSEAA